MQAQQLSWQAFVASIPVAILIALILYVNEIPDRHSDAKVGERTLPVRLGQALITRGFLVAALSAFAVVATAQRSASDASSWAAIAASWASMAAARRPS